jgi:hypothetical protein
MIASHNKPEAPSPRSTHLGYDAGRFGLPMTLNPYKPGTHKARHWLREWKDGVERLQTAQEAVIERSRNTARAEARVLRNAHRKKGGRG